MRTRLWNPSVTIYALAAAVGVGAGLGAVAFQYLSHFAVWLLVERVAGYAPAGPRGEPHLFSGGVPAEILPHALLWLPALGALLASLLCRRLAPEATGHGTDAVIDAYHRRGGLIRPRVPFVKAAATALTLGTGGSGGREGPIAQIGAGIGSMLAVRFRLKPRYRRILVAAGMGAGIGAIFRAPLAGALFASEILYRDPEIEGEAIMPSFIACTVAYCVFCGWFQDFGRLFGLPSAFGFHQLAELVPYTVLGLLLVPFIYGFTFLLYRTEHLFRQAPWPKPVGAALGGLLCGATGLLLWRALGDVRALAVMGQGYGVIQEALDGLITGSGGIQLLFAVAALKIVTTSLTIGSGGSAGVFGPSMVTGGALGGAVGLLGAQWGWVEHPSTFVIVGMCGFFAGAARTPISTIIMVTEITGSYQLLLPAMWVCGIAFLLAGRTTLYSKQVPNRAWSPAHRGEYVTPLLQGVRVQAVLEAERAPVTVQTGTTLAEILRLITRTQADYFPVLDAEGRFVGIFSAHDIRSHTYDPETGALAIADDVMTTDPIVLTPDDDLHEALEKFDRKDLDELPVVDAQDPTRLLGMLRRRAVMRAYGEQLQALREHRASEGDDLPAH
jgi:CIC family chloride channel protein